MPVVDPPNAQALIRAALVNLAPIPDAEWEYFRGFLRERRVTPREHLIWEGRSATSIYLVVQGLVRLYYNEDGRESVRGFVYENQFVTAYESVLTGQPSGFSVQAIEPTHTIAFDGTILESLYERHPSWERFGRRILEQQWIRQADRLRRFTVNGPEEHYRLLLARRSPLIDRVPLNQLALYLGVAPETLSRIRARLRDEKHGETAVDVRST